MTGAAALRPRSGMDPKVMFGGAVVAGGALAGLVALLFLLLGSAPVLISSPVCVYVTFSEATGGSECIPGGTPSAPSTTHVTPSCAQLQANTHVLQRDRCYMIVHTARRCA